MSSKESSSWLKKSYWGFVKGENFIRHLLLFVIRIYWGSLLVISGLGKLTHVDHVVSYFTTLELPNPTLFAYGVGCLELIGGASLFLGLFSRFFGLLLSILLIGAYVTAHKEAALQIFSNPQLFIQQEPFLYLYTALLIVSFGPGMFSLDYWIERKEFGEAL